MSKLEIKYQEVELNTIIQYFVDGYDRYEGSKVSSADAFIDTAKGKVILKLYVKAAESKVSK